MKKTYLLFLYSDFDDHEDVEFFCFDILGICKSVKQVRYVIEENPKNFIVIFESDSERRQLSQELQNTLTPDKIKFFFLFERDSIFSANLPTALKDFMFKPKEDISYLKMEYTKKKKSKKLSKDMDLDTILEKIQEFGKESLSEEEKKFLDNFQK